MNRHEVFMKRCQELARQAAQTGNTPVGAVVVCGGIIIGEGQEATRPGNDITCHAEVEAIRDAIRRSGESKLSDCSLYTTHEPCILCSYVIRHHQLALVVFEIAVPTVGGFTCPHPILTVTDISVWGPPPVVLQLKGD
ncbi:nucleoside deaminase [Spirosoma fluviale]|uniref:Cytidine and deoxycytidylate deaminase zinc-binding region n=1 Tax=Spirosoma fluviale TaxID=1597977 RepID=A0A286GUE5_9BACT|nr:nucleoside deaminase [Spirosoma fluviale]SOD99092.1 Cytidine and deoxycytidylate deaminase zinc-binding region [Spirosoma fluviale]